MTLVSYNFFFSVHVQRVVEEVSLSIFKPSKENLLKLLLIVSSDSIYYLDHMETLNQKLLEENVKEMIRESKIDDIISIAKKIFTNCSTKEKTVQALHRSGCIDINVSSWPDLVLLSAIGFYDKVVQSSILEKFKTLEGFNPNICGNDRITPMHVAASASSRFIVSTLLDIGASNNLSTIDGK